MEKRQDIVTGLLFAGVGISAAWMATGYKGASGIYPMTLGLILTLLGALVALRAVRSGRTDPRALIEAPTQMITATVVAVLYLVAVVPLGFYTASFFVMLAMPFALGFRKPVFALIVALVFIALVYLVFTVLLEKPLPREAILALMAREG